MRSSQHISKKNGFTLLEVLVCAGMIVVIASVSLYSYDGYRRTQAFSNAQTELVGLIRQAQSKTLAGDTQLQYGVHLTSSGAALFSGNTYGGASSTITTVSFDPSVTLSNISLSSGTSDIVFLRGTGEAASYGTLVLTNNSGKTNTIVVQETGTVSDQ